METMTCRSLNLDVTSFKLKDMSMFESCKDPSPFFFDESELNEMTEENVENGEFEGRLVEAIWQDNSNRLLSLAKDMSNQEEHLTPDPGIAARLLRLACRLDSVECVKVLVEGDTGAMVFINEMDEHGWSPLHNAAQMHSTRCIDLLLSKNAETGLRSKDEDSLLALEIALSSERMPVNWSPKESVEELLVLLRERDLSAIRLLARATKEVADVSYKRAMERHIVDLALLLLVAADKVITPVSVNVDGFSRAKESTTVYQSVVEETLALAEMENKILGDRPDGIQCKYRWDSVSILHEMRILFLREIELLQKFGAVASSAQANCKDKHRRRLPPLLLASQIGDESVVQLLFQAGADVNEMDADGDSVLHHCLKTGFASQNRRLVGLLLNHGARVSHRNRLGLTPVHVAAEKCNYEALQILLLQSPECTDLVSETQETPLFYAVRSESLDCVKLLLQYGANSQASNLRRQRPIDLAKSQEIRFILNPLNHRFLNRISPPRGVYSSTSDEISDQILDDYGTNTERALEASHHNESDQETPVRHSYESSCCYTRRNGILRPSKIEPLEIKPVTHFQHTNRRIFIGGLPAFVDSECLEEFFEVEFGPVEEATVMYTKAGSHMQSRGFGFVTFEQEETAAIAVHTHFVTICGKKVEIKSAVGHNSLEPEVVYPSQPKLIPLNELEQEPASRVGSPLWVTKFRQWFPIFLAEACGRLGEGKWYPLSALKQDFRATCGMELDHLSLGFDKLGDFISASPALCRIKTVSTGNSVASHMVISPLKIGGKQAVSEVKFYALFGSPSEKPYISHADNERGGPDRDFDSILGRIDRTNLAVPQYFRHSTNSNTADAGGSTPPSTGGGGQTSRGGNAAPFSYYKSQWFQNALDKNHCAACFLSTEPGTMTLIPCRHKVCRKCKHKFEGTSKRCLICGEIVAGTFPESEYPPLSGEKQSKKELRALKYGKPTP